jgi:hypothetical protein
MYLEQVAQSLQVVQYWDLESRRLEEQNIERERKERKQTKLLPLLIVPIEKTL